MSLAMNATDISDLTGSHVEQVSETRTIGQRLNLRDAHRDAIEDIRRALHRSGSPHTLAEVIKWLTTGELQLIIGNYMSASYRLNAQGSGFKCQIVHVGGEWDDNEADWMLASMRAQMRIWCVSDVQYEGRPGWSRFLKSKGIDLWA